MFPLLESTHFLYSFTNFARKFIAIVEGRIDSEFKDIRRTEHYMFTTVIHLSLDVKMCTFINVFGNIISIITH